MREINVALIGTRFMGKAHSFGYRALPVFFATRLRPVMKVICGRDEAGARQAAERYGWQEWSTDWQAVVARPDIHLVDISSSGEMHRPMALAAAQAGKDILCEKPLGNSLAEAQEMLEAVEKAGVKHMTAFNFRTVPAITLAHELIQEGRLGEIYHWRAHWLSDWIMAPDFPLVWRLQADKAGLGALGDIGAHVVDLARWLVGEVGEVVAMAETFIKERPLVDDPTRRGQVTVDDGAAFLARFANGALGVFEVTRFAGGNKERMGFEVNGSKGSLRFEYNHMNELDFFSWEESPRTQGFRTIFVGNPAHPYVANWWPNGHFIHYGALFVNQVYSLLEALADGRMPSPNFRDGLACQAVLEAAARSVAERRWVAIAELLPPG
jgi:predicted dehydrogenase